MVELRLTVKIARGDTPNIDVPASVAGLTGRYSMAAIAPPLVIILIIALVFYLARRSAYKKK